MGAMFEGHDARPLGIVPCQRCAYFVSTGSDYGFCRRHAPRPSDRSADAEWPIVELLTHGCGDGYPRELTTPLPEPAARAVR